MSIFSAANKQKHHKVTRRLRYGADGKTINGSCRKHRFRTVASRSSLVPKRRGSQGDAFIQRAPGNSDRVTFNHHLTTAQGSYQYHLEIVNGVITTSIWVQQQDDPRQYLEAAMRGYPSSPPGNTDRTAFITTTTTTTIWNQRSSRSLTPNGNICGVITDVGVREAVAIREVTRACMCQGRAVRTSPVWMGRCGPDSV